MDILRKMRAVFIPGVLLAFAVPSARLYAEAQGTRGPKSNLERFDGGFFSIDKPEGWQIFTGGACADFGFVMRDPSEPLRQVFYFGEVGPVYLNEQQKQVDSQYMSMGGFPLQWFEMPVVDPLTPGNFLSHFHLIAKTQIARNFMPQCPRLEKLQIVSAAPRQTPFGNGSTELLRAVFNENGTVGEGLFLVTVAPVAPFAGLPGGGIAYGFMVTGISAPRKEFRDMEGTLAKSLGSFTISQLYVKKCLETMEETVAGILRAGKTLSEASDIIIQGWESRNKSDDIISEKRSDAILGKERLYDPGTGDVYEFENGFYDKYQHHRGEYEMDDLQPLPGDSYELWTKAPLDGLKHLK